MRLGADPEVFLQDANGKAISAIGYINASKWAPLQLQDMEVGFTLQEDNVSLEFGIPPASSAEEFIHHIKAVMQRSLDFVPGLSFSKLSCIVFPEDQMKHPRAHIFGCEPDYNAWTLKTNKAAKPPHKLMRSAGGHIHVETEMDKVQVVRAMDLYLGVPSVLMDRGEDRRKMYGGAGAHRPKPYGVEYRTLSNFWIMEDRLIEWAWNNTARALEHKGELEYCRENILEAIDGNSKEAARELVDHFNLEVLECS
jgi:hypothetical protein